MIRKSTSLSMAESLEYIKEDKKIENPARDFMKKFVKLDFRKAKELRKKLEDLKIIKMKDSDISKLLDILPEKNEELNKIFTDVSLDEDESKKILDTIKGSN